MNHIKKKLTLSKYGIKFAFKLKYIDIFKIKDDDEKVVLFIKNKNGSFIPLKKNTSKPVKFSHRHHKVINGGSIQDGKLKTAGFQIEIEK